MKVKVIATMLLLLSLATNVMGQEGKKSLGNFYFNSLYQPLRELCCNFVEL